MSVCIQEFDSNASHNAKVVAAHNPIHNSNFHNWRFIMKTIKLCVVILLSSIVAACGGGGGSGGSTPNPYDGIWTFNLTWSNCSTAAYTNTTSQTVSGGQFGFSGTFTGDTCLGGASTGYTFSGTIDSSGNLTGSLNGPATVGTARIYRGTCGTTLSCAASANSFSPLYMSR